MTEDPIVEQVRQARAELFARFDNDLDALVKHLQARTADEERAGRKVVALPPRKPEAPTMSIKKVG